MRCLILKNLRSSSQAGTAGNKNQELSVRALKSLVSNKQWQSSEFFKCWWRSITQLWKGGNNQLYYLFLISFTLRHMHWNPSAKWMGDMTDIHKCAVETLGAEPHLPADQGTWPWAPSLRKRLHSPAGARWPPLLGALGPSSCLLLACALTGHVSLLDML